MRPCFTPLPFSVELDAYGASLTCHVPRTYHAGSGVVRADKAGEAFTRQHPAYSHRRAFRKKDLGDGAPFLSDSNSALHSALHCIT